MIAIATSLSERVRLAELVSGETPMLLVSTAEEAVAFLVRMTDPPVDQDVIDLPVVSVVDPARRVDPNVVAVDSDWRVVTWRDRSVGLSPLEHDLLQCLLQEVGHTWTFEQLQLRVWGNDHQGGRSHLQTLVKRLRRKLSELGAPLQIDSVRGIGLRLLHDRVVTPINGCS